MKNKNRVINILIKNVENNQIKQYANKKKNKEKSKMISLYSKRNFNKRVVKLTLFHLYDNKTQKHRLVLKYLKNAFSNRKNCGVVLYNVSLCFCGFPEFSH